MINPHGGELIERIMSQNKREEVLSNIEKYIHVTINPETVKDVENIAYGTFSPLCGFMDEKNLIGVRDNMRLASGAIWTIPILLDVSEEVAGNVEVGQTIVLVDEDGNPSALMEVNDKYSIDKDSLNQAVFLTTDEEHPGVAKTNAMSPVLLGGDIEMIQPLNMCFKEYNLRPRETRVLFEEKGWKTIVAFQTRNAPHNGHEYVQKAGLTFTDGLFINPVIGKKKAGDFTDEVILSTYEALVDNYYPKERVVLSILPFEMRYGGPREAIFHAIIRKNYGCSHIIIGRDHAGVGDYYGPFDAHKIFDKFPDLEIQPYFFRSFFFCKKCNSIANDNICPHEGEHIVNFAGRRMRELLTNGERPDDFSMRAEVVDEILKSSQPFVE